MSTERVIGLYKARLLEATCRTCDPDWAWRKWYEGKTGQLYLMHSQTDPLAFHICFNLRHIFLTILKETYEEQAAHIIENRNYMILSLYDKNSGRWEHRTSGKQALDGIFPTPADLDVPGWVSVPTAEDFARFETFLDNNAGYPLTERISPDINEIIEEEISAFFAGVGSAEDCAKKIQSRASIWLSENR